MTSGHRPVVAPAPVAPPAERLRVLGHCSVLAPIGGVEMSTLQDSVALAERGHRVDLLHGGEGPLRPFFEEGGIGLHGPFPFSFAPRTAVRDLAGFAAPARLARALRPDVVWLNRAEHLVWGQVVSRWTGAPLVCHLHALPPYERMGVAGRGVAHFLAVSDYVRQAYLDRGIAPERVTTVQNAVSADQYPPGGPVERAAARDRLDLPQDVPIVLCYGQMTAAKGVPTLLEAWRQVWSTNREALLVLVDSHAGEPDEDVRGALRALDPAAYRIFPMASDVVPFLHASDVVAFPTRLPETFGRVVLEGLATGRPVLASRTGALPEILDGPMDRFLLEPGAVAPLVAALEALLHWREREPGLQELCTDWVVRNFPVTAHVDRLELILERHRRRRRRPR